MCVRERERACVRACVRVREGERMREGYGDGLRNFSSKEIKLHTFPTIFDSFPRGFEDLGGTRKKNIIQLA